MNTTLVMPDGLWQTIGTHLLPPLVKLEQAAFLFAMATIGKQECVLHAVDVYLLRASDYSEQRIDYLEATDGCKSRVIKQAHNTNTCVIEMHSHPGPWPAEFSPYDLDGLRDTVPHMMWRLRGRPYAAVVLARSGFDALVWAGKNEPASALTCINADGRHLYPTGLTLERAHARHQ